MSAWSEIRGYLLDTHLAKSSEDRILVKIFSPDSSRSQVVSIHMDDSLEVVVQSPFAMLSEVKAPLSEVLKVVCAETRFGFRLDGGCVVLINRCPIAVADPLSVDRIVRDMAVDADLIEQELGIDSDSDRF